MQVDGSTVVLGIFGDPVEHSLSPRMQNAAIAAAGINAVYVPFHVEKGAVGAAVAAVRALGLLGVNVTVPHKEAVLPYLDAIDAEAEMIGAVNTIVNRCGRLIGYNTDGQGFLASLRSDLAFDPGGRKAVVLGAGGAARAAVAALAKAGAAAVTIVNRSRDRAETLRETFRGPFPDTELSVCAMDPEKLEGFVLAADLLVNTTTVGLHGD